MKITDHINAMKKTGMPKDLIDILLSNGSIWSNDACYGYCIMAMEAAGYSRKQISDMLHHLHEIFDNVSPEDAESHYTNW